MSGQGVVIIDQRIRPALSVTYLYPFCIVPFKQSHIWVVFFQFTCAKKYFWLCCLGQ